MIKIEDYLSIDEDGLPCVVEDLYEKAALLTSQERSELMQALENEEKRLERQSQMLDKNVKNYKLVLNQIFKIGVDSSVIKKIH